MSVKKITLNRIAAGHYASPCGKYAVVQDGYTPGYLRDPRDVANGLPSTADASHGVGGEWAAVVDPEGRLRTNHNAGENLDWFSTKREAVECVNHHARSN